MLKTKWTCVGLALSASLVGVSDTLAAQGETPDTALFEMKTPKLTIRAHGDTVWLVRDDRTTRYVEKADTIRISIRRDVGTPSVLEYVVRGDTAYPTNPKHAPTSAEALRSPRLIANSARRVARLGLPTLRPEPKKDSLRKL